MTDTMNETVQTESSPLDAKKEKVRRVQLSLVDDFPNHPFKMKPEAIKRVFILKTVL